MSLHTFLTLSTRRQYFLSLCDQVKLIVPFLTLLFLSFLCPFYIFVLTEYFLLILSLLFFGERIKVVKEHSYNYENIATQPRKLFSYSYVFLLELLIIFFFLVLPAHITLHQSQILKGGTRILLPHSLIFLSYSNMNLGLVSNMSSRPSALLWDIPFKSTHWKLICLGYRFFLFIS